MTETFHRFAFPDQERAFTHALKAELPDDFHGWSPRAQAVGMERAGTEGWIISVCIARFYFLSFSAVAIYTVGFDCFFRCPVSEIFRLTRHTLTLCIVFCSLIWNDMKAGSIVRPSLSIFYLQE